MKHLRMMNIRDGDWVKVGSLFEVDGDDIRLLLFQAEIMCTARSDRWVHYPNYQPDSTELIGVRI